MLIFIYYLSISFIFIRLSRELEDERQANMHNVISSMMAGVKEQKVNHLKSLKKLTNEKNALNKKFKEVRDENSNSKILLDEKMKKYQTYQFNFDESEKSLNDIEKEEMEVKMAELLTVIERERTAWMYNRDSLKVKIIEIIKISKNDLKSN